MSRGILREGKVLGLTNHFSHWNRGQFCILDLLDRLPTLSRCPGLVLGQPRCRNFVQGSPHLQESLQQKTVRPPAAIFPLVYRAEGNAHLMRQLLLGKTHALAQVFDQRGDVIVSQQHTLRGKWQCPNQVWDKGEESSKDHPIN